MITRQVPTQTAAGVIPLAQASVCGQRYHDGGAGAASGGVCRCGTFSVGICTSCGSHVCGDHSVAGSQRICDLCIAKRRDDVDREITDAYQRDLDTLKKINDPHERLVRALAYLLPEEPYLTSSDPLNMMYRDLVPLTRPGQYRALAEVCPDVWPDGEFSVDLRRPPWDSAAIAAWFVREAAAQGVRPHGKFDRHEQRRRLFGAGESVVVGSEPAWVLPHGSDLHASDIWSEYPALLSRLDWKGAYTAFLLQDGQVMVNGFHVPSGVDSKPMYRPQPSGLGVWGLVRLAGLLIPPPDGDCANGDCSALAVGRCVMCGRSFCVDHRSERYGLRDGTWLRCATCQQSRERGFAVLESPDPAKDITLAARSLAANDDHRGRWDIGDFRWSHRVTDRFGEGGHDVTQLADTVVLPDGNVARRDGGPGTLSGTEALQVIAWRMRHVANGMT